MNRIKAKFTGGPDNGQMLSVPADAEMYHTIRLNKAGRLMVAVYHKQKDGTFKHSYYVNEGREWRDD